MLDERLWTCALSKNILQDFLSFLNLKISLRDLKANFSPIWYSWNGPELLTRVLGKFCKTQNLKEMTVDACGGFNIIPIQKCFNLNYNEWPLLFDEGKTKEVLERLKDSIIVHYWTSLSRKVSFPSNITNAFTALGRKLCPRVMWNVGEFIT